MKIMSENYQKELFSAERLYRAWIQYRHGKRRLKLTSVFELRLEREIIVLACDCANGKYFHSPYRSFTTYDPKRRTITAAALRDRLVHQIVYEETEKLFDKIFLDCSYSGRKGRGVHAAVDAAELAIARLRSQGSWPVWAIKLDVKKFYGSVDHKILLQLLMRRITNPVLLEAIKKILASYNSNIGSGKGIPIGNLTSQIFANVYLHELDRFAKHTNRIKHYFRYADDMLIIGNNSIELERYAKQLCWFAKTSLHLEISSLERHCKWPRKVSQGADWLGTVIWPYGRTLRRATRGRIMQKIKQRESEYKSGLCSEANLAQMRASYNGMLLRVRDRKLIDQLWQPTQSA